MINPLYQELREHDIDEAEIEQKVGEGWSLERIYVEAADAGTINVETGYCMCGSPVEGHGIGDGHSPVDMGYYQLDMVRERLS